MNKFFVVILSLGTVINVLTFVFMFRGYVWQRGVDTAERVYYISCGGVICARRELTSCGVRLSNCYDSKIYECQQNVSWEDQ